VHRHLSAFLMLLGPLISAPLITIAGVVSPTYNSLKSLQAQEEGARVRWLQYWLIFALVSPVLSFLDLCSGFIPLYFEAKVAFVLWLSLDQYQGASLLCKKYLEPLLMQHQNTIDETLVFAVKRVKSLKAEDVRTLVDWVSSLDWARAQAAALSCGSTASSCCDTPSSDASVSEPVEKPGSPTSQDDSTEDDSVAVEAVELEETEETEAKKEK